MYLLDTDVVSNLLDAQRTNPALRSRFRAEPLDDISVSIVSVEEMLRGAMDRVRRAQTVQRDIVNAYALMLRLLRDLHRFAILPYDADADKVFRALPQSIRRIGTADCRIASTAVAHRFTVVTANTRHFRNVPGLVIEDWTLS